MCGIAGIVAENGCPANVLALEAILGRMTHRGPDDSGLWTGGTAALGHRRLSIIDLVKSVMNASEPQRNIEIIIAVPRGELIYVIGVVGKLGVCAERE